MIRVREVTRRFGGLIAVDNVSLDVAAGGITGLIGPNGAGKTTLLSMLAGQLRPQAGQILLDGQRIDGLPAHRLHALGLARTFQIPRPFRRLTVLENLLLARPGQTGERLGTALWQRTRIAAAECAAAELARALLGDLRLARHADAPAGELSGGQQKLLELARALMAAPRVLVLDEPCAGLNPSGVEFLSETITRLRNDGLTFVIVEHNIDFVARHCDHVVVMAQGRVLTEGRPEAVRRDSRVLDAFLGAAHG
jgi:branched-chain amino acid transport system ATP-binding protein